MKPLNDGIDRRGFLVASLAFANAMKSAEPRIDFPTQPRQRLAVSSYPFRSLIESPRSRPQDTTEPRLTLQQFAESIPARFQVSGIEPWSRHFESIEPDYVRDLSLSFKKAGVRVVNIPVDERVTPCSGLAGERDATSVTWRKWVDVGVALGSPGIRVHMPPENSDPACVFGMLGDLAAYGSQKNIVINLENDNPRSEEAFRIVKTIEKINSQFLRALPDFCNSMLAGDEEYNYRAVTAMFAHAFNISHVKDEEVNRSQVYRVDLAKIFAIAKRADYHGYFSMEWEGSGDPYEGTRRLIEESLKNLT